MESLMEMMSALAMLLKLGLFIGTIILTIILFPTKVRYSFNKKENYVKSLIGGLILFLANLLCFITLTNELPKYEPIFEVNSIVWGVDVIINLILCWGEYFNQKEKVEETEQEKEAA